MLRKLTDTCCTLQCTVNYPTVPPMFLSTSSQVDITINSNNAITLKCSLRGYPLSALHWKKGDTPLAPDGSHINIITFRRQSPMDTYPFSSTLDSSFQPIPLEGLVYFEAVSELTLVPPIVKTDTANYTCVVEADFVHSYAETSDNIPVNISGQCYIHFPFLSLSYHVCAVQVWFKFHFKRLHLFQSQLSFNYI